MKGDCQQTASVRLVAGLALLLERKGMIMEPQEAVSSLHREKLGGSGGAEAVNVRVDRGDT